MGAQHWSSSSPEKKTKTKQNVSVCFYHIFYDPTLHLVSRRLFSCKWKQTNQPVVCKCDLELQIQVSWNDAPLCRINSPWLLWLFWNHCQVNLLNESDGSNIFDVFTEVTYSLCIMWGWQQNIKCCANCILNVFNALSCCQLNRIELLAFKGKLDLLWHSCWNVMTFLQGGVEVILKLLKATTVELEMAIWSNVYPFFSYIFLFELVKKTPV